MTGGHEYNSAPDQGGHHCLIAECLHVVTETRIFPRPFEVSLQHRSNPRIGTHDLNLKDKLPFSDQSGGINMLSFTFSRQTGFPCQEARIKKGISFSDQTIGRYAITGTQMDLVALLKML